MRGPTRRPSALDGDPRHVRVIGKSYRKSSRSHGNGSYPSIFRPSLGESIHRSRLVRRELVIRNIP